MTYVKNNLDNRLIGIPDKDKINTYNLGEYNYSKIGVDCDSISIELLYEKLCCGQYDPEEREKYLLAHEHVCDLISDDTLSINKRKIEEYIETVFLSDVYEFDKCFNNHIENSHPVPNDNVNKEKRQELALAWLCYVVERGLPD